ncbi:Dirigent protein 21 [Capsicum annuum]|uniref:dirigent protein 22 n=1 Tax=Capsicum annuum TaxID=4072 RepID=UPI0007BFD86D|nr:dirigent protein 22 [Capsicum annuum]KAF3659502.1 Dirigent protein 21 [Capsicum annuum]KAF3667200.1 Dirigent protein 21 [Capsicum annuum]
MGKINSILLFCSIAIVILLTIPVAHCNIAQGPKAVDNWFQKLSHAKQKMTKLHFYFHDIVSGRSPTAVPIAQANSTSHSPTAFGQLAVLDDRLTTAPEINSTTIGRAQGIVGAASLEEFSLLMSLNFVFTNGKYSGSTLSLLGCNTILNEFREMPIVGGSGVFRLARGVATAKTHTLSKNGDAIVEYNIVVLHY